MAGNQETWDPSIPCKRFGFPSKRIGPKSQNESPPSVVSRNCPWGSTDPARNKTTLRPMGRGAIPSDEKFSVGLADPKANSIFFCMLVEVDVILRNSHLTFGGVEGIPSSLV